MTGEGSCKKLGPISKILLQAIQACGMKVELAWVPSRYKASSAFKPHPSCIEQDMRLWNDLADKHAKNAMKRSLQGSLRAQCNPPLCPGWTALRGTS